MQAGALAQLPGVPVLVDGQHSLGLPPPRHHVPVARQKVNNVFRSRIIKCADILAGWEREVRFLHDEAVLLQPPVILVPRPPGWCLTAGTLLK